MFKIYKGGDTFFQWDIGQRLIVEDPEMDKIHFCNKTGECSLVCEVYEEDGLRLVNVPNILLQVPYMIRVYGCLVEGEDSYFAKNVQIFKVIARTKPEDYVYTEEELKNWDSFDERIALIEEDIAKIEALGYGELATKTDVKAVGTRIDNLVAENTLDSNAELIDIRVGADDTQYESAGAAVRAKVNKTDIVSTIGTSEDKVMSQKAVTDGITSISSIRELLDSFQIRNYTWANKAYSEDGKCLTSDIVEASRDIFLKLDTDYEMFVYFFSDIADTSSCLAYGGNKTEVRIIEGQKFAIKIMRIDRANVTLNEKFNLHEDLVKQAEYAKRKADDFIKPNSRNVMAFEDGYYYGAKADATNKPFLFYVKNNHFYVTSNGLVTDARIKVSNGYSVHWGNFNSGGMATIDNTAEAWLTESVAELEAGKTYCIYTERNEQLEDNNKCIFSVRDSSYQSMMKERDNPTMLEAVPSFVTLFISATAKLCNYELALVIEESNEPTGTRELDKSIRIPQLANYVKKSDIHTLDYADILFYESITGFTHEKIHEDALSSYGAVQGMGTDGENLYYSIWRNNDAANTLLCKYNIASDSVTLTKENHSYGHANGIAYIANKNELYVCNMDNNGTVSRVNPDTLEFIDSFSLYDILNPVVEWYKGVGAVAYDSTRGKIVYLLRGTKEADGRTRKGFAIFDNEMRFEKIIKTEFIECGTYSGISTDENFIYLTISNPSNASLGEWLVAYDWNGNFVYKVQLKGYNHVEAQAKIDGVWYFADNRTFKGVTILKSTITETGLVSKLDVLSQYNLN